MKKFSLWFLVLGVVSANAAPVEMVRTLRDQTTTVALVLDSKTVFCTDKGYGNIQLKVTVPDLDWLAHFDHRVAGEGLPCMTAGRCTEALGPKDILNGDRIGITRIRSVLNERIFLDADAKTCLSNLEETVTGTIRGIVFNHVRGDAPVSVDYELCTALIKEPTKLRAVR
jgi:hypothetical protein